MTCVIRPLSILNRIQVHRGVVVGGWVSLPDGRNRRTVGHRGRTKLLLHAHCFDTLGDPIELNANAKKRAVRGAILVGQKSVY